MGHCDRLLSTPVPVTYTRMTNRVLVMFGPACNPAQGKHR